MSKWKNLKGREAFNLNSLSFVLGCSPNEIFNLDFATQVRPHFSDAILSADKPEEDLLHHLAMFFPIEDKVAVQLVGYNGCVETTATFNGARIARLSQLTVTGIEPIAGMNILMIKGVQLLKETHETLQHWRLKNLSYHIGMIFSGAAGEPVTEILDIDAYLLEKNPFTIQDMYEITWWLNQNQVETKLSANFNLIK